MTSTIPQPIENYIAPLLSLGSQPECGPHSHNVSPLMQPQPIEYNYSECACDSCQYYRQSSMSMYSNSVPSTPTSPISPVSPFSFSHNPYASHTSQYPASSYSNQPPSNSNYNFYSSPYDQSAMTSMPSMPSMPMQPMQSMQSMQPTMPSSMPLQQIQPNMYYGNQMQQQQQQGMCYPDHQSSMMMQPSCYPQTMQHHHSQPQSPMDPEAINHPVAYSLTEQFRHIVGSVVATACTPRGRSLLQSVMRLQHSDKVQTIFDEIVAEADVVMIDPNGCHVVRSIIEMLDEAQVRKLVAAMTETTILNVATTSQYTRRILQVMFERHKPDSLASIVDVLSTHALSLATTQQGCIALMRVIERCSAEQKEKLLVALQPSLLALATDPFGNYVVQSVLEHYKHESVTAALKGSLLKLATNKFASNVMEKAFRFSAPAVRAELVEELFDDAEALNVLVQDGFGNFVIQSVIDSCQSQSEFRAISEKLRPLLHSSTYGHKIESKMRNKKFHTNVSSAPVSYKAYAPKEDAENMMPL